MATISAGTTETITLAENQIVSFAPDPGETATYVITRAGSTVGGDRVSGPRSVGPLEAGDSMSITADRGAVDYTLASVYTRESLAAETNGTQSRLLIGDGVVALSEVITEVAATASAGATVLTGAGTYAGYRCTVAAGNITVYDNTAASGKVLVPTTALAVGSFPIYGAGHPGRVAVTTGVHVVLSGAATVQVGVEAA